MDTNFVNLILQDNYFSHQADKSYIILPKPAKSLQRRSEHRTLINMILTYSHCKIQLNTVEIWSKELINYSRSIDF